MYGIKDYEYQPENFLAGDMKVAKEALTVKEGEVIKEKSLVKLVDGEAAAFTSGDADLTPYGIAAADSENGSVVVYLTGEFMADALVLPEGVTVDAVKPKLRENGIFLR